MSFVGNNDLYKEAVLFIKKLVDEKLLDPSAFTQDATTLASRQSAEPYLIGALAIGQQTSSVMDTASQAYNDMVYAYALEGPYGYKATGVAVPAIRRTGVITTACENPEAAFKLLDFFLTEEAGVACRVGFEGSEWRKAEEGEIGRNGDQAKWTLLKNQEWTQPSTNVFWCAETNNFSDIMNYVYDNKPVSNNKYLLECPLPLALEYDKKEYLPDLLIDAEDALEYNELKKVITDYVTSSTLLFALGDKPMEDWDAYCAELDAMGLNRYIEMTQAAYDKRFK